MIGARIPVEAGVDAYGELGLCRHGGGKKQKDNNLFHDGGCLKSFYT
jgi:hypothetical protein